jgi:lipopolysaccharide transport system ATP-binding protein
VRPVVVLEEVSKVFRTAPGQPEGLKTLLLNPRLLLRRRQREWFRAIDRVSLEVRRGEAFGLIGRNGAGKTTILGLMGGILRPTSGRIAIEGRIAPLLELGVGFTHELTGRENIVLNGVLLGMRRRQVEARLESIIEFSGLRDFIDQPLKAYSSGMQMRLGFSIAVHSDPGILLIDEVLAVGDAEFQRRCLERVSELRRAGVTIVFVSHDLQTVESVCDRVGWLDRGRLVVTGTPPDVVRRYRADTTDGVAGRRLPLDLLARGAG